MFISYIKAFQKNQWWVNRHEICAVALENNINFSILSSKNLNFLTLKDLFLVIPVMTNTYPHWGFGKNSCYIKLNTDFPNQWSIIFEENKKK